ncbi:hypothetical protein CYMTET_14489 [Cymbomonas tetramitiformis]|uniref:Cupin-like domain-containing protein n=1 Tax=Cymbomonas tetramitiformis TaxID=36881 RepID=A0AAE0GGA2_9CHLO|nr:hypothetical protein CYMTET_14489 [Cymbomonas tetramitiformis]
MVNLEQPCYDDWPGFSKVHGATCILEPGEVLYLPMWWWRHIQDLGDENSTFHFGVHQSGQASGGAGKAGRMAPWLLESMEDVWQEVENLRAAEGQGPGTAEAWSEEISVGATRRPCLITLGGGEMARAAWRVDVDRLHRHRFSAQVVQSQRLSEMSGSAKNKGLEDFPPLPGKPDIGQASPSPAALSTQEVLMRQILVMQKQQGELLEMQRQQAEEHRLLRDELQRQAQINVELEAKVTAKPGTSDPDTVAKTAEQLLERRRKLA